MKWVLALCTAAGLAACGADGEPVQPTRNATITLSDAGLIGTSQRAVTRGAVHVSLGQQG